MVSALKRARVVAWLTVPLNSEIKIKGAVRIPADDIEARLKEIPHDREIVVYCT